MAAVRFLLLVLATVTALRLPQPVQHHCAPSVRRHTAPAALADNPFGSFFGGLANALESALDAASGGQQSLINDAEAALNKCSAATSLLGTDVSIGEINAGESMSIDAGVQIVASASGSLKSGTVTIGGSRDDDALTLEVLSLAVGDEVIDVLDP